MSTEHGTDNREEAEEKGSVGVIVFLLISAAILLSGIGLMDVSLLKAPDFIQMIYDKVTLPSSLHFVTYFKGLFAFVMTIISCVPALIFLGGTAAVMSKAALRE